MIIVVVAGCAASVLAIDYMHKGRHSTTNSTEDNAAIAPTCGYSYSRVEGFRYIKPLFMVEPTCESVSFLPLKKSLDKYLTAAQEKGQLKSASIYVKDFISDDWMVYNPGASYHPGSLFKVVTMISLYRMAESNPSIMSMKVTCPANYIPAQKLTFESRHTEPGHTYTVQELLRNMIVYSDNDATTLLHNYINRDIFINVFTDLQLHKPDSIPETDYELSVKEYSRFVSVLYEGGYLSIPSNEAAMSLLCDAEFHEGITKQLPSDITVAHKYGESASGNIKELHESAVIYLNNHPYLITVMTSGYNTENLAPILSDVSKMVFDHMTSSGS